MRRTRVEVNKRLRQGISIKAGIGIGDALQYSSLPQNYFMATGKKLVDVSRPWFFDHNPYVDRSHAANSVQELWNFSPHQYPWPNPREENQPAVYNSNAEIWASLFKVKVTLNRPRLYRFEDFPFEQRRLILLQVEGVSHGRMPLHIIEHVKAKYEATGFLRTIGPNTEGLGIPHLETPTLWDLAHTISTARMLICLDSAPAWVAACYPDVIVKKVRMKPRPQYYETWVPLEIRNIHSHWDDRCHMIFNPTENDIGFTTSYKRI